MALYRLEAKIFSREKRGRSVVAAAAYRNGGKIRDEKYDRVHDYSRRSKGVVESVILRPDGSPGWTAKPDTLWNTVELGEKRVDAQLAREFILAVPPELNAKQQFQLAVGWAQTELVDKGMVAEVSLHHTKTGNNPHVHILCTMRRLDGDKFSAKKPREWNDVGLLCHQRESWAEAVNGALEKAGRPERVDHRSLKDRGIDRIPEPKIGKEAMGLKKRGVVKDPERFKLVRWVKSLNAVMPWKRAIQRDGEVHQHGLGRTWWERSLLVVEDVGKAAHDAVRDTWAKFLNRQPGGQDMPPQERGPDLER
jgi:ATP-dependent exoDNAse (exonuclease V) alpha subunit